MGMLSGMMNRKGAPFTGPLDGVSATPHAVHSLSRRLLSSYTDSTQLIRLRRVSDDAQSDFGWDADGNLDTAAIATWIGASSAKYVKVYDQSGNGYDWVQASAAAQPDYVASGINGKPSISWPDSTSVKLARTNGIPSDWPVVVFIVSQTDTANGQAAWCASNSAATNQQFTLWMNAGTAMADRRNGGAFAPASTGDIGIDDDAPQVFEGRWLSDTSESITVNGANGATDSTSIDYMAVDEIALGLLNDSSPSTSHEKWTGENVEFVSNISLADRNLVGAALAEWAGATWTTIT